MKSFKKDFPILRRKINGKYLTYLDSASTSQKPQQVIDTISRFYKTSNSNIHRGIYTISEEATKLFEDARAKVARFINARSQSEIIFTHNTTEALNIVAYGLGKTLKKGDTILISEMEHHSNIVPWQRLAKEKDIRLLFMEFDKDGKLIISNFTKIPNLKIVSLTHVSNVLGTINPIEKIIKDIRRLRYKDIKIVIDGAQSVPHMSVDVQKLDCDFLAFSAHKMLGPTGVGVLYGKKKLLETTQPLLVGSNMIKVVSKNGTTWNDIPWKFEPGTAAIEAVVGFGAAIDFLNKVGMDNVRAHEQKLIAYSVERIIKIPGVELYGPRNPKERGGVISFNIKGVHSHDVAQILDQDGICIRSGHHCAMPLHQKLGIESSARASFYIYNDERDVDKLIEGIKKVKKIFK